VKEGDAVPLTLTFETKMANAKRLRSRQPRAPWRLLLNRRTAGTPAWSTEPSRL